MKRLFVAILVMFVASMGLSGCGAPPQPDGNEYQIFHGEHTLHKIAPSVVKNQTEGGGCFFICFGVYSGGSAEVKRLVTFSWYSKQDDAYITSTIPLENVRVRIKDNLKERTVEFGLYDPNSIDSANLVNHYLRWEGPQGVIDHGYVVNVTFTVAPSDWPVNIQMPLNQPNKESGN